MAYKKKIYQLWIYDGYFRWHVFSSYTNLDEAIARFTSEIIYDPKRPLKDFHNFSYKVVNKETGEVLKRHVGALDKYARFD